MMKLLYAICVLFFSVLISTSVGQILHPDDSLENSVICDFNRKQCKWSGADGWEWILPEKSLQFDGPPVLDSSFDHAIYVNYTHARVNKIWAQTGQRTLSSPLITPKSAHSCFRFNYAIRVPSGNSNGLVLRVVYSNNTAPVVFHRGGEGQDSWFEEQIDIVESKYFRFVFEAYSDLGYIALQSFKLDDGPCFKPKRVCDFEDNLCGWNSDSGNRSFELKQAASTSQAVIRDVTLNSAFGNVIAVEDMFRNGTFKLAGPVLTKELVKESTCFSFWSQRTQHVKINLYRREPNGVETELWHTDPDYQPENEWKQTQIKLNFSKNIKLGDRLIFEVYSKIDKSAAAFDDFEFKSVCDSAIACSFNKNLCGWIHDLKISDALWSRGELNRVVNASRLDNSITEKMKRFGPTSVGPLYTDFTAVQEGVRQRMELHSNFVDGRQGCAGLMFTVDNIGKDPTNSFRLDQLMVDGRRNTVWSYNTTEFPLGYLFYPTQIPIPAANQPYRLVLHASSTNPSTRIGVAQINFIQLENGCQAAELPRTTVAPKSQMDGLLRRLIVDLLRGLRSDAKRIHSLSKAYKEDPLNLAVKDIINRIENAMETSG